MSDFLKRLRPEPGGAFLALRALALSLGPDVSEQVADGGVTYCRRERSFLSVRPARSHLSVVFPEGLTLTDPMGRLMRRGPERYVNLETSDGLDGHVQEFVRKAYAAARGI